MTDRPTEGPASSVEHDHDESWVDLFAEHPPVEDPTVTDGTLNELFAAHSDVRPIRSTPTQPAGHNTWEWLCDTVLNARDDVREHPWTRRSARYLTDVWKPRPHQDVRQPNIVMLLCGAAVLATALLAALTGMSDTTGTANSDAGRGNPPTTYGPEQTRTPESLISGDRVQKMTTRPTGVGEPGSVPPNAPTPPSVSDFPSPGEPPFRPPSRTERPTATSPSGELGNGLLGRLLRGRTTTTAPAPSSSTKKKVKNKTEDDDSGK